MLLSVLLLLTTFPRLPPRQGLTVRGSGLEGLAILFGRVSLEKVSRSPVLCLKYLDLVLVFSSLNKIDLAFLQVDPLELNILETVLSPEDVLSPF